MAGTMIYEQIQRALAQRSMPPEPAITVASSEAE
jgi:hypothetical protein